jgi:hypothetical protein
MQYGIWASLVDFGLVVEVNVGPISVKLLYFFLLLLFVQFSVVLCFHSKLLATSYHYKSVDLPSPVVVIAHRRSTRSNKLIDLMRKAS